MIPTDIPMMLTIAVGLKTGSDRRFFQIMLNMKRFAICCDSDYLKHISKNAGENSVISHTYTHTKTNQVKYIKYSYHDFGDEMIDVLRPLLCTW